MKKVLIIINKSWEADPIINAMVSAKLKPKGFPFPVELNIPVPKPLSSGSAPKSKKRRACFQIWREGVEEKLKPGDILLNADIWCIEDIMTAGVNSSSSEEKHLRLLELLEKEKNIDLVMAVGTACFNDRFTSFNGSVVLGSEFVTFNALTDNPDSKLVHKKLNKYLSSNLSKDRAKALFGIFDDKFKDTVESKLLSVPNCPAPKPKILAASNYVALSNVNITNYNDYAWADEYGLQHYHKMKIKSPVGSIETTHGVIRLASELPIVFVSAIADRLGYFSSEVNSGQNYVSSFNAGIFLSYLLPALIPVP